MQGPAKALLAFLGRGGSADGAVVRKGWNPEQEREGREGLWVWCSCCGQAVLHHGDEHGRVVLV